MRSTAEADDDATADGSGIVFYTWDVAGDEIRWQGDITGLLGLPADADVGSPDAFRPHIAVSDRSRVVAAVGHEVEGGTGSYDLVYALERPDGSRRWVRDAGRVEGGSETPVCTGAILDVTGTHDLTVALADSEGRYRDVLERTPLVVYTAPADDPTRTVHVHGSLGVGGSVSSPDDDPYFWERLLHPDDRDRVVATFERAAADGSDFHIEYRYVLDDGRRLWVEDRGRVVVDTDGERVIRGVITEITRRRLAELGRERLEHRARLLAELSRDLAATERDIDALVETVVRRVGTVLEASCAVHVLDGDELALSAAHHPDAGLRDRLVRLMRELPHPADEGLSGRVLRTGDLSHVGRGDPGSVTAEVHAAWREAMLGLDVVDVVVAPLRAPGGHVGVIAVARHGDDPPLRAEDESFLRELADRTGLAVSNALLWAESIRAEEQARDAAEVAAEVLRRHRIALDAASSAVWEWDIPADRISWSGPIEVIAGTETGTAEHGRERFLDLLHPEDRPATERAIDRALSGGAPYDREFRLLRGGTGEITWVRSVAEIRRDENGTPVAMIGVLSDITSRKTAEEELADRAAQQEGIASLSQLALTASQLDQVLTAALELVATALHAPYAGIAEYLAATGELRLRAAVGLQPGLVAAAPRIGVAPSGVIAAIEADAPIVIDEADEELFEVAERVLGTPDLRSSLGVPITDRTGTFGLIGVLDHAPRTFSEADVTFLRSVANVVSSAIARRDAEEQLVQAQKMEAIGRLAGGVAHDFNNLLTVLLGLGDMLRPAVAHDEEAAADLREMIAATERAADLIDQLLTFSRGSPGEQGASDAADVVSSLQPILERFLDDPTALEVTVEDGGPTPVDLDRVRLAQIVVNLVINARDAVGSGGRIVVEVRAETGSEGGDVVLRVSDDGAGMDEATLGRCLEPFFTTKGPGGGTGLGLSTVYGIVRQVDGELDITSAPEAGTTVTVRLPGADPDLLVETTARDDRTPLDPGGGRVLVVEDQAAVRRLVRDTLTRHGYEVAEAASGPEALARVVGGERPDLVLTDVVMPQMAGPELVARLRQARADLRVLYMSGHADLEEGTEALDAALLAKPFRRDELLRAVASAMGSSA